MKTKVFKLLCISLCLCCVFNLSSCYRGFTTVRGTEWENEFMTVYVPESGSPKGTLTIDGVTYNISIVCHMFNIAHINDADFEYKRDESGNIIYDIDENGNKTIRQGSIWSSNAVTKKRKSEMHVKISRDYLYETGRSKVDYTGKTIVLYRKA